LTGRLASRHSAPGQTNRRIALRPMRRRTQRAFLKPPLTARTAANMRIRPLRSRPVSETPAQCENRMIGKFCEEFICV
jgi:hypothetical protein